MYSDWGPSSIASYCRLWLSRSSHMDKSLFTRFVCLGIPCIELNAQGRARPSIAKLYNWRYRDLGDLAYVKEVAILHRANAGFSYDYQLVDVPDYCGRGESAPSPWFYQNEGEAEYIVSVYIYMHLLGYPANKISILTTYNGQKLLIHHVINRRCFPYDFIGPPSKVATVDKFQECQVEDTGPVHLVSGVDDMNIVYQQLYQAKFGQYMAYSGQLAPGLIEPISKDVDGVRESGPDENNTEDKTKMEVLANGENGGVQSESHSNGETDGNVVLPDYDSPKTKMDE